MRPILSENDRIIATPLAYGSLVPFLSYRLPGFSKPHRGDVVLSKPKNFVEKPLVVKIFDQVVRFFTLQKVDIQKISKKDVDNDLIIKRIVGIPGDTIKIKDHTVYIKPEGNTYFIPEQEIIRSEYRFIFQDIPEEWDKSDPFSDSLEEITLKEGEYYLLGDNRSASNDSRYWGPVPFSHITAKVILKYWPINEISFQ